MTGAIELEKSNAGGSGRGLTQRSRGHREEKMRAGAMTLAEKIFFGGANDAGGWILYGAITITTNDNHGRARGFSHEETGSGS